MSKIALIVIVLILVAFFIHRSTNNNQATAANVQAGLDFLAANRERPEVVETESGLQYQVLEAGSGTVHPDADDRVKVHYHGSLIDGTVFDSSLDRSQPLTFGLRQVIPGWTEGLQLMVEGETARLFIPAELAYGRRKAGSIPPGSVLIFDVTLLGIESR